jgi:transmembrane sensor
MPAGDGGCRVTAAVSPAALEQAAEWLVRLQDGATSADRVACEQWRDSARKSC